MRMTFWLLGFVMLLAACGPSPEEAEDATGDGAISCQVFYRAAASQPLDEGPAVDLAAGGDQERLEFGDLTFDAVFFVDQGEGRSLSLSAFDPSTGEEVTRQLYQLDPETGLSNQFIGGHGFTGLIYVYHPTSTAEMQYFCQAV